MTARNQSGIRNVPRTGRDPSNMYSGKVIAVNPEDTSVDIRMYAGDTLRHVRVLQNSANTVAGFRYLSSIKNVNPHTNQNGVQDTALKSGVADTIAIVGYLDGNLQTPRVIGFDFPIDSQLHLNEQGLSLSRHESGVYELIDKNGHHETHYPDGSYVIMSTDTTPKDISSIQGNGQAWNVKSAPNINLTIHLAQGVTIQATNGVLVVNGGTKRVSGVGDTVQVNLQTGIGTITSGSSNFLV